MIPVEAYSLFPFCPVWTQSTWTALALAEPSNRGLLIADGISIHVCRRLLDIRQSCWVARAPQCPSTPLLRYAALTGQGPCQAFSGYLQWCQTPRWRGRDGDDLVHLRAGFDLGWVENQPKVQPDTQGEDITVFSHCTEVAILHF